MNTKINNRNLVAKDLRTPKYRMRVILKKNTYKRKLKNDKKYEFIYN